MYILLLLIPLMACGNKIPANAKMDTFGVLGNCGMCKKKIEKSLKVDGVYKSDWNKKTKMITVYYDPAKISLDEMQQLIAKSGYDNDGYKANAEDYDQLHSCCKYDRTTP